MSCAVTATPRPKGKLPDAPEIRPRMGLHCCHSLPRVARRIWSRETVWVSGNLTPSRGPLRPRPTRSRTVQCLDRIWRRCGRWPPGPLPVRGERGVRTRIEKSS
eukprot:scaffold1643_cov390-Prasinococcus_capsulatus_cf.AAC.10